MSAPTKTETQPAQQVQPPSEKDFADLGLPTAEDVKPTEEEQREDAQPVEEVQPVIEPEAAAPVDAPPALPEPVDPTQPRPYLQPLAPAPAAAPEAGEDARLRAWADAQREQIRQEEADRVRLEREQERRGMQRTIDGLRAARRVSPEHAAPGAPNPPAGGAPAQQAALLEDVPIRFNAAGDPVVAREDLARMIPAPAPPPQPPPMDEAQVVGDLRERARQHFIMQDPTTMAAPTNAFFRIYDEVDGEVRAAQAQYGSPALPTMEAALEFMQQTGIAQRIQGRYPALFEDSNAVLDFVEAGTSLSPRKMARAIDGIRYAVARSAAPAPAPSHLGNGAGGAPPAEGSPPLAGGATPPASGGVERLPVERPRPMGQRGRGEAPGQGGRHARYEELMAQDPFTQSEADAEELRKLSIEIDMEEERAAEEAAARA